jgi:penicillin-binding protein 1A
MIRVSHHLAPHVTLASRLRKCLAGGARFVGRHRILASCAAGVFVCAALAVIVPVALVVTHVYGDDSNLPDAGPFVRFEFPAIGHVYDASGQPLIELAREYRSICRYEDIPVVVRQAVLATEDKRFFTHNGVDYSTVPRVLLRIRMRTLLARLFRNPFDEADSPAIFPQGGSTITQQLVRGYFLKGLTAGENSRSLRGLGRLTRSVSYVLGARNANMIARKAEEIRLSIWIETEMTRRFGSKQRAKEEIFARYASYVYMGHGQYGFATAARYYLGTPLTALTAADADRAALLAGIAKSPRDYAPGAKNGERIVRRRNQTLALMAGEDFISAKEEAAARHRPLPTVVQHASQPFRSSAVVAHVLDELEAAYADLGVEDLLHGRIQVHSTVDARVQRIANDALQHGLERYEQRHPRARGLTQGAVVVLKNGDGSILAEVGGREVYQGRATSYSDFNRVTESLRQPGSAMKPIVFLAAFLSGHFTLETLVPDEPISVADGRGDVLKWISNYDGRFKGMIPIRQALAESRNAAAIWMTAQVGIDSVLSTARALGVKTRLQRNAGTALGASEVSLLELATAYRTIASGVLAQPSAIRQVVGGSGDVIPEGRRTPVRVALDKRTLALIQEGLRGVVRLPTGTAHALDARAFPIPVMGKTGTTNDFRDALFVGSTYGVDGITVAVRIGFDDNRSLGENETGARVALPVFRELMLKVYGDGITGPAPRFPQQMEQRIADYMERDTPALVVVNAPISAIGVPRRPASPGELQWLLNNGTVLAPFPTTPLPIPSTMDHSGSSARE